MKQVLKPTVERVSKPTSGLSRMSRGVGGLHLGGLVGMEGKGGSGEPPNNLKNNLYLEEFLSTLKLINQTCYILNINGQFKFSARDTRSLITLYPRFLENGFQITLSIKTLIIYILLVVLGLYCFPWSSIKFICRSYNILYIAISIFFKTQKVSLIKKIINYFWPKSCQNMFAKQTL